MFIFDNNNLALDSLVMRTARLRSLKRFFQARGNFFKLPRELLAWSLTAYDVWVELQAATAEKRKIYQEVNRKLKELDRITFVYYARFRNLIRSWYNNNKDRLAVYGIKKPFHGSRTNKINQVKLILDGHKTSKEMDDHDEFLNTLFDKLEKYYTASENAYHNFISVIKPVSKQATANKNARFKEDTKKLLSIYIWSLMTWDKNDPDLLLLGFAPRINKAAGTEVNIPVALKCKWESSKLILSWQECEQVSGYQLACSEDLDNWEELHAGDETTYSYEPPVGTRTYKVRARNAHGYSGWSDTVEFELPE